MSTHEHVYTRECAHICPWAWLSEDNFIGPVLPPCWGRVFLVLAAQHIYSKIAKQELLINSPLISPSECRNYGCMPPTAHVLHGFWVLSSGGQNCMADTFTLWVISPANVLLLGSTNVGSSFLGWLQTGHPHAECLCRLWLWISSVHSSACVSSMKSPTGLEWSTPFLAQKSLPGLEVGRPYDLHFTSGNILYANTCKSVFWGDLSVSPCICQH